MDTNALVKSILIEKEVKPRSSSPRVTTEGFVEIDKAIDLHSLMLKSKDAKSTLVLELYSGWCGPCLPIRKHLKALNKALAQVGGTYVDVPGGIAMFGIDTTTVTPQLDDGAWKKVLQPFANHVEPIYLFVRGGVLCGVVEGANIPLLDQMIRTVVHTDPKQVVIPITQREAEQAAFRIQSAFRRKKQMKRLGIYINGVFYTHAEIKLQAAAEVARQHMAQYNALRKKSAIRIQSWYRGHLGRQYVNANRKTLEQRFRVTLLRKRAGKNVAQRKEYLYTSTVLPNLVVVKFTALLHRVELSEGKSATPLTEAEEKIIRKKIKM